MKTLAQRIGSARDRRARGRATRGQTHLRDGWEPPRRFGLDDRGRIGVRLRADLLLVDGNPTVRSATHSTCAKCGAAAPAPRTRKLVTSIRPNLSASARLSRAAIDNCTQSRGTYDSPATVLPIV
jgi:hypothetical protein